MNTTLQTRLSTIAAHRNGTCASHGGHCHCSNTLGGTPCVICAPKAARALAKAPEGMSPEAAARYEAFHNGSITR